MSHPVDISVRSKHGIMRSNNRPLWKKALLASAIATLALGGSLTHADDDNDNDAKKITFIHTSDIHGDFHDHVNVRDEQPSEGGLARVYTKIQQIRKKNDNTFYVHTGDTIVGSGEVLFTKGQAMIDVMNKFGVQGFAPGNWEYAYGIGRFRELFLGTPDNPATADVNEHRSSIARWGITAVNSYYNGEPGNSDPANTFYDPAAPYPASIAGNQLVAPYHGGKPYRVVKVGNVKLGIFGCTTNRGPQIVGANVTAGITFSNCKGAIPAANNKPILWQGTHVNQDPADPTNGYKVRSEIPYYVDILRNHEKVDMVILLSEAGLAENIYNAENFSGVDVIFSSDMHEETNKPVVIRNTDGSLKTIIIEEGEDGAQVGQLDIKLKNGKVNKWKWKEHDITPKVKENKKIAKLIHRVTAPFESGSFTPDVYTNPFNGTKLMAPLDEVIGYTDVELSRNNYAHMWDEANGVMPGVIEGTAHSLVTDAFRLVTNALLPVAQKTGLDAAGNITPASDGKYLVGAIRGFRYVNSYPAGSAITYGDLYHFLSIGPQVGVTDLTAGALNNQTESAADSTMNPDVTQWAGGWFFNFSGVTMNLNPYAVIGRIDQINPVTGVNYKLNDVQGYTANFILGRTSVSDDAVGDFLSDSEAGKRYRYASYYYDGTPNMVNNIPPAPSTVTTPNSIRKIMRVKGTEFGKLAGLELKTIFPIADDLSNYRNVDGVEVVAIYIKEILGGRIEAAELPFPRIHMTEKLQDTRWTLGFPSVEPLYGANKARYYDPDTGTGATPVYTLDQVDSN